MTIISISPEHRLDPVPEAEEGGEEEQVQRTNVSL